LHGNRGVLSKRPHISSRRGVINKRPHCGRPRGVGNKIEGAGDYLDELRARVEQGKLSEWQHGLLQFFRALAFRLERVTLFPGSWERCVSDGILNRSLHAPATHGILLDPPYKESCCDSGNIYSHGGVWSDVLQWCKDHGDRPDLRIALAGYWGTCDLVSYGWKVHAWTHTGGARGKRGHERLWFSPACLP
jgi:hypothetical protein